MVVNENTITTYLLFVETRPRQKLENQLEMRHESISITLQFTFPRSSLARKNVWEKN